MSRKTSALVLIVLTIALILIPSVHAEYPIENMVVVQPLPDTLITGNSYEMFITFDNAAKEAITFVVKITVTSEEPIGYDEIFIDEINLNGFDLDYVELPSGVFTTVEGSVAFSSHDNELSIIVYTAINLMPGTYTFEVDLLGEEVFDFIVEVLADTPTTIDASEEVGVVLEDFTSTEPATVTINLYEDNPYPEADMPLDSPMALGIFLDFTTTATDFTTEIRVYYTDEQVDAADIEEEDLRLYYLQGGYWTQCVNTGVNTMQNYIWAVVDHFTVFAPFGTEAEEPEPEPEPTPSPPSKRNKSPVAVAGPNQTVYVDYTVYFNGSESYDPDGAILSWRWDFGDGVKGTGETVSYAYSEPGNYTVTLKVKDRRNAEGLDTCVITVRETPVPPPPPPPPLSPLVFNLTIVPEEIELGEEVTISFVVKSRDSEPCTYVPFVQIGEVFLVKGVELDGYESKTVSHTMTPIAVGEYDITVDGMTGSFTVVPIPVIIEPVLRPAEFVVTGLMFLEPEVEVGEENTISVAIENIGEQSGSYTVTLRMESGPIVIVKEKKVTLEGGGAKLIDFTFALDVEGIYEAEVEGMTVSFTVLPPPEALPFWMQPGYMAGILILIIALGASIYAMYRRGMLPLPSARENK